MPLESLPAEFLFTMTANIADKAPAMVGAVGGGTRMVFTAMSGTFEGPKLRGVIADVAGGDWVMIRADRVADLNVRLCLQTDDGATIFLQYTGMNIKGVIRVAIRFEAGDERYTWLNSVQAVGLGTSGTGTVSYDVYSLTY